GLHVGHPEGYTATDILSRYWRSNGFNVLHTMGWDAFGLPAEQYAVKNTVHPAVTTKKNIANFRRQIQSLGLSYDWDREIDTTDPHYYRWTQWIFLQLYNSYFDPFDQKAKPIAHLLSELENENILVAPDGSVHINPVQEGLEPVSGEPQLLRKWSTYTPIEQRAILDGQRLAYTDDAPVNWCPALGTVLANEEVIDGKSEVGGFPVERRPMRQWMLRITAYADRLIADLDGLDWPESIKEMQRNWIGRSVGAEVDFEIAPSTTGSRQPQSDTREPAPITVFTTRPDTLFGATYLVLAPEHDSVFAITTPQQYDEVTAYLTQAAKKSDRERQQDAKEKTGVFTGAYAINPVNDELVPIWIADYVLTGYGTGAIMAVPAHDERDFEFATKFGIPIKQVVAPTRGEAPTDKAFTDEGIAINSGPINGMTTQQAKQEMIDLLDREGTGRQTINYKLRDWLFSRQRYWGEPFPIVLDSAGNHYAVSESELPVTLPEIEDFKPTGTPEPPLSKAKDWLAYGPDRTRETNTMPQWAGSCWYYLRYIDPNNPGAPVDADKETYWMPVDLYVGGVEHAVLHLLYARFWHKVLFDIGVVHTPEPFQRLVNQGLILGEMEYHFFESKAGPVSATEITGIDEEAQQNGPPKLFGFHKKTGEKLYATRVIEMLLEKKGDRTVLKANPDIAVDARSFKMSKSRGNVVNPDEIVEEYGADCFRLYEMYMGPLEQQKPWNTRDIVGMWRFLNSVWRNLIGDDENPKKVSHHHPAEALDRQLHRTIKKVSEDIEGLRFNTAIAELIKLNNELTHLPEVPLGLAEIYAVLLSPFAPHMAEEIWERLGKPASIQQAPWPQFDPAKLVESTIELPVQVNGKLRDKISVAADATEDAVFAQVEASEKVKPWLEGKTVKKRLYVSKKMVNYVVA
ncbi:MAG: leucine--tRNA ligase, partial [Tepidisphaeraceae bacterium]